jgi:hypothetical protein
MATALSSRRIRDMHAAALPPAAILQMLQQIATAPFCLPLLPPLDCDFIEILKCRKHFSRTLKWALLGRLKCAVENDKIFA